MNRNGNSSELREQLEALVSERPDVPSPAPLVIGKVRRSRRRRQAVGALAVVAAVTSGVLVGVHPGGHHEAQPATPTPQTLCRAELPPVWAHALEPGVFKVGQGKVLAASPDGGAVFVQDGGGIARVTASGGRQAVMSLPKGHSWEVDGSLEGDWFVFGLRSRDAFYSSLFTWNVPNGELRQVPLGAKHVVSSWTLGPQYLAWESGESPEPGGLSNQQHQVMRLSDGAVRSIAALPSFYAGSVGYASDSGRLVAHEGWTQAAATVPPALATAFHPGSSFGSWQSDGVFSWMPGNNSATNGPSSENVWDTRTGTLTQVAAPTGDFVQGVVPVGGGYAVAEFAVKGHKETAEHWLVDLRSHSYAPLTQAQAAVFSDQQHAIPLTQLSRLPGCS